LNNLVPYIASMFIGGIIGYSTNWIAIKMLFRPLNEVKVFGIKIPFTPGVIPKQRKALGNSIGKTVENYLLTHESINETIGSVEFQQKISSLLRNKIQSLSSSQSSITDLFDKYNLRKEPLMQFLLVTTLNNRINFVKAFSNFCGLIVKNASSIQIESILKPFGIYSEDQLSNYISKKVDNGMCRMHNNFISNDLSIDNFLTDKVKLNIEELLLTYSPHLLSKSSNVLDNNLVRDFISKSLKEVLSESFFGGIVRNFVSIETLTDMTISGLKKKLSDPNTIEDLKEQLPYLLQRFYSVKLYSIGLLLESEEKLVKITLQELISDMVLNLYRNNKHKSLNDLFSSSNEDLCRVSTEIFTKKFDEITTSQESFNSSVEPIFEMIMGYKISGFFTLLDENIEQIVSFIGNLLTVLIDFYGEKILSTLDVKTMVEVQIDKLNLLQVEEIILGVMNNQLKAITWFGLFLGALLGLLMPYLNSILS